MTVYSCTKFDIAGLVPIPSSKKTLLEKLVESLGDGLLQPRLSIQNSKQLNVAIEMLPRKSGKPMFQAFPGVSILNIEYVIIEQ